MVEVELHRWNHEFALGDAKVVEGEPYVLAHHRAATFVDLVRGLAATGHSFTVRTVDVHVTLMDLLARRDGERTERADAAQRCIEQGEMDP